MKRPPAQRAAFFIACPRMWVLVHFCNSMLGPDTGVACWNAKFTYSFWRPVTAVRAGGANSELMADQGWASLANTPNHPEYPAAHGCVTDVSSALVEDFFGTGRSTSSWTTQWTAAFWAGKWRRSLWRSIFGVSIARIDAVKADGREPLGAICIPISTVRDRISEQRRDRIEVGNNGGWTGVYMVMVNACRRCDELLSDYGKACLRLKDRLHRVEPTLSRVIGADGDFRHAEEEYKRLRREVLIHLSRHRRP